MQPNTGGSLQDYFNSPELTQAQGQYQSAAGAANQSAAEDVSLPAQLRQALAAKFGEDNPLIKQRADASTAYLNSIPSSYNDVLPQNNNGIILSPTQQAMMIGAKQNAYLQQVANANSLISSQSGNLRDLIEAASTAHQGETKLKLSKADLAKENRDFILNKLSAQADQAYKQQQLDFQKQQMQLQYGPIDISAMLGGINGGGQGEQKIPQFNNILDYNKWRDEQVDKQSQGGNDANRQAYQALYSMQRDPARQKAIENAWKLQNPGVPLFQQQIQGTDLSQAKGTVNLLAQVRKAQDILQRNDIPVGGLGGMLQKGLISNNLTRGMADKDVRALNDILTQLRTVGEKSAIGGRLTGYLLNQLNPAYPSIDKPKEDILSQLHNMEVLGQQDLQNLAKSKGWNNLSEVPGFGIQVFSMIDPDGKYARVKAADLNDRIKKGYKFPGE